jgi:hypothetical protein
VQARVVGIGVGIVIGALAGRAEAFPSSRLTFSRGSGAELCPDETELRKAVVARLGYDPFFPWADVTILARITSGQGRLVGTVELLDKAGLVKGSRELTAQPSQCGELISSMALAISIAIDPQSLDRGGAAPAPPEPSEPEPAPEFWHGEPGAVPADMPPAAPKAAEAAASADRWKVELEGGIVGSSGFAPGAGVGPEIGVRARRGVYSGGVEARYQFVRDLDVDAGALVSSATDVALSGCVYFLSPFFGCAVAGVGVLTVEGDGVTSPRSESTALFRAGPRAGIEWEVADHLGLRSHADLAFNLTRPEVELDGVPAWNP